MKTKNQLKKEMILKILPISTSDPVLLEWQTKHYGQYCEMMIALNDTALLFTALQKDLSSIIAIESELAYKFHEGIELTRVIEDPLVEIEPKPSWMKSIHTMLDVSTGHISKETADFLRLKAQSVDVINIVVYEKGEYGFWIPVIPEDFAEYEKIPEDLIAILDFALSHNMSWIMLDRDGDPIEGLTYNEW